VIFKEELESAAKPQGRSPRPDFKDFARPDLPSGQGADLAANTDAPLRQHLTQSPPGRTGNEKL
jgi:hypothetical protein